MAVGCAHCFPASEGLTPRCSQVVLEELCNYVSGIPVTNMSTEALLIARPPLLVTPRDYCILIILSSRFLQLFVLE